MGDEVRGHGVSVTLKQDRGYEAPWINFAGTVDEVKADLAKAFGFGQDEVEERTLAQLVFNAASEFHAPGVIKGTFPGARVISDSGSADPWETDTKPAKPAPLGAQAEIEVIATLEDLGNWWGDQPEEVREDPAVVAAFKAKGKALKAAKG